MQENDSVNIRPSASYTTRFCILRHFCGRYLCCMDYLQDKLVSLFSRTGTETKDL